MSETRKQSIISTLSSGILDMSKYQRTSGRGIDVRAVNIEAMIDYLRCVLAMAVENAFKTLTPKYRNEHARRKFFDRLALVAEQIHLSDSYDRFMRLLSLAEADELESGIVRTSFKFVDDGRYPDQQLTDLVRDANAEFAGYIHDMEELTGIPWKDTDKHIKDLKVFSFFDPWYNEDEKTGVWGVGYYPSLGIVNICPPLMFFGALRRGVLAREAARLFTPDILDRVDYAYEQAEYLSHRFLADKYEAEFWLSARHGLRQDTRKWAQTFTEFFPFYESLVGKELYKKLWKRLDEYRTLSIPIRMLDEYQQIFDALGAEPVRVRFGHQEVGMLRMLASQPLVSFSTAAHKLGLSIPTTMRLFRVLFQKAALCSFLVADMRALGLVDYFLFMNTNNRSALRKLFIRMPYCRVFYSLYGTTDAFALVNVPFKDENFARELLGRLQSSGLISKGIVCESRSNFSSVNYDSYEIPAGDWDIHWDSWGSILRERLSGSKSLRQMQKVNNERSLEWVRKIDMQIMEKLYWNCRRSHSEIGHMLGVSGAYVGRRIQKLVEEGIFKPVMVPNNMGAEDHALLALGCSDDVALTLAGGFDRLPRWRGALISGDVNGILADLYVPVGEIEQLFKQIDERLAGPKFVDRCLYHVVGSWSHRVVRWLPVDLYSDRSGWIFNRDEYLALVG